MCEIYELLAVTSSNGVIYTTLCNNDTNQFGKLEWYLLTLSIYVIQKTRWRLATLVLPGSVL